MNQEKSLKGFLQSAVISLFLAVFYLGVLKPFNVLEVPNLKAQDLFFRIRNQLTSPPQVLDQIELIIIDDESIEKSNQKWPFKRKIFADLVNDLSEANPRVIAFDFVFSGKSDPVDDFLLSSSFEKARKVILASFVDTNGNYILPYQELLSQATAVGIINKIQDRDLTVRRANLIYPDAEGQIVGLPWELEIAKIARGFRENELNVSSQGIQVGGLKIPFYKNKKALVNYRFDFAEIKPVRFWGLSKNQDLRSKFSGKIVLIGTTSKVLHDFYHTPLGLLPGVVINLNFLANILSNDFIKPLPSAFITLCLFLFSFAGIYLGLQSGVLTAFLTFGGLSFLFLLLSFGLFLKNYLSDYFTPLLFGWFSFVAVSFYRYFFTLLENIQLRTKVALDPLTGLYNRRFLESNINQVLEKNRELSVLMIDIDNFKIINDTYGHQFGDDVIKNISFAIKEELREGDTAVRYGGEEFCVILPKTTKLEAADLGEKIRTSVSARKFSYVNQVAHFTVSIGVASSKSDQLMASRSLIRAADQALYDAKKTGKNKVALFQNL